MKQFSVKSLNGLKMKFGIPFIMASLILMSFLSLSTTKAQSAGEIAEMADVAIKIGKAIDSSCDSKRPEGGFTACKGKVCAPAKCISFRSRCNGGFCA